MVQLADTLDLDERGSARLLLYSQEDAEALDRSSLASAVIVFHERRQFLLECLRLLLQNATDPDGDEGIRQIQLDLVCEILGIKDGPARNGSLYVRKCLAAMGDIEKWLQALGDRYQGTLVLGQTSSPEYDEIMAFQQQSLEQQHESLSALITHMVKGGFTSVEDFHKLLDYLPTLEKWNLATAHYVPIIAAFTSQYGSSEFGGDSHEASSLNRKILDAKDTTPWHLRNLQAATVSWWLAEYSGWVSDPSLGSSIRRSDAEAEARTCSEAFLRALRDGAFQCTLAICSQIRPNEWCDPARTGLIQYLLRDTPLLPSEAARTSHFLQDLIMEQFETFVDAFITNMPDTLRQFQVDEDDQRKNILGGFQPGSRNSHWDQDLHLERFLVIISFAFNNRVDAAQSFWIDTDSNLYGFLQWASRRQSTPRVGAFCEMLISISQGEECASAAHTFLLDEGNTSSARVRRSSSISWAQIISELSLYASRIRETLASTRPALQYRSGTNASDIDEPESELMLECYLRLTSHLCRECRTTRSWFLTHQTFHALEIMFCLCTPSVPHRLQAGAFDTLHALLTEKSLDTGFVLWNTLDQWASGALASTQHPSRPGRTANPSVWMEEVTFEPVANNFDEACSFVRLLQSLVSKGSDETGLRDALPFPEQLGAGYRMPGIEPYVDLVFDRILASKIPVIEEPLQFRVLTYNVLNFAATSLASFNEDLLVLANKSTVSIDTAITSSSLAAYVRLHPFNRVMEWMFNDRVLAVLFAAANQDVNEVASASPTSPLILSLLRTIEVMNLVMDSQATYFNLVRPLIKMQSSGHRQPVLNPTLVCFEDSVASRLDLIVDLCLYCGVGNQELALVSLKLLGKLAGSKKLNTHSTPGLRQQLNGNRLIAVLEQNDDLERIRRSFISAMHFDSHEIEQGSQAAGWTIKSVILDFLRQSLLASPGRPTLAHALLGFTTAAGTLSFEKSLFAERSSLFHAIIDLVANYPGGNEDVKQCWALSIKQKGLHILSILWNSPLTSVLTLAELRMSDFLFAFFLQQTLVGSHVPWDGRSVRDPDFMSTSSAEALKEYLDQRCHLFEYTSIELRLAAVEGAPTLKTRILSTLLGSTTMPDGGRIANLNIFDLLDFLDFNIPAAPPLPPTKFFSNVDFTAVQETRPENEDNGQNMNLVEQLLALRLSELGKTGQLQGGAAEQQSSREALTILTILQTEIYQKNLQTVRLRTLNAWANLVTLFIGHFDLDQGDREALILQALQVILPKLESYAADTAPEAVAIGKLLQALMYQVEFKSCTGDQSQRDEITNDRLSQVFRTVLRAINISDSDVKLREILYNVCFRYLTGILEVGGSPDSSPRLIQLLKSAGRKVIDIICDDAYGGNGTCRISALLLLSSLASAALREKSNHVLEALVRTNFIIVLVEGVVEIQTELQEAGAEGKHLIYTTSINDFYLSLLIIQMSPSFYPTMTVNSPCS